MSDNMENERGEMIIKRVSVPIGLEELMEGLTKEILLKNPDDIYLFAAEYFAKLLSLRDKGSYKAKPATNAQSMMKHIPNETSKKLLVRGSSKHLSRQISTRSDSPIKKGNAPRKFSIKTEDKATQKETFMDRRNKMKNSEAAENKKIDSKLVTPKIDLEIVEGHGTKRDRSVSTSRRGRSTTRSMKNTPRQKSTSSSSTSRTSNISEQNKSSKPFTKEDEKKSTSTSSTSRMSNLSEQNSGNKLKKKDEENTKAPNEAKNKQILLNVPSVEEVDEPVNYDKLNITAVKDIKRCQMPAYQEIQLPEMAKNQDFSSVSNKNSVNSVSQKEIKEAIPAKSEEGIDKNIKFSTHRDKQSDSNEKQKHVAETSSREMDTSIQDDETETSTLIGNVHVEKDLSVVKEGKYPIGAVDKIDEMNDHTQPGAQGKSLNIVDPTTKPNLTTSYSDKEEDKLSIGKEHKTLDKDLEILMENNFLNNENRKIGNKDVSGTLINVKNDCKETVQDRNEKQDILDAVNNETQSEFLESTDNGKEKVKVTEESKTCNNNGDTGLKHPLEKEKGSNSFGKVETRNESKATEEHNNKDNIKEEKPNAEKEEVIGKIEKDYMNNLSLKVKENTTNIDETSSNKDQYVSNATSDEVKENVKKERTSDKGNNKTYSNDLESIDKNETKTSEKVTDIYSGNVEDKVSKRLKGQIKVDEMLKNETAVIKNEKSKAERLENNVAPNVEDNSKSINDKTINNMGAFVTVKDNIKDELTTPHTSGLINSEITDRNKEKETIMELTKGETTDIQPNKSFIKEKNCSEQRTEDLEKEVIQLSAEEIIGNGNESIKEKVDEGDNKERKLEIESGKESSEGAKKIKGQGNVTSKIGENIVNNGDKTSPDGDKNIIAMDVEKNFKRQAKKKIRHTPDLSDNEIYLRNLESINDKKEKTTQETETIKGHLKTRSENDGIQEQIDREGVKKEIQNINKREVRSAKEKIKAEEQPIGKIPSEAGQNNTNVNSEYTKTDSGKDNSHVKEGSIALPSKDTQQNKAMKVGSLVLEDMATIHENENINIKETEHDAEQVKVGTASPIKLNKTTDFTNDLTQNVLFQNKFQMKDKENLEHEKINETDKTINKQSDVKKQVDPVITDKNTEMEEKTNISELNIPLMTEKESIKNGQQEERHMVGSELARIIAKEPTKEFDIIEKVNEEENRIKQSTSPKQTIDIVARNNEKTDKMEQQKSIGETQKMDTNEIDNTNAQVDAVLKQTEVSRITSESEVKNVDKVREINGDVKEKKSSSSKINEKNVKDDTLVNLNESQIEAVQTKPEDNVKSTTTTPQMDIEAETISSNKVERNTEADSILKHKKLEIKNDSLNNDLQKKSDKEVQKNRNSDNKTEEVTTTTKKENSIGDTKTQILSRVKTVNELNDIHLNTLTDSHDADIVSNIKVVKKEDKIPQTHGNFIENTINSILSIVKENRIDNASKVYLNNFIQQEKQNVFVGNSDVNNGSKEKTVEQEVNSIETSQVKILEQSNETNKDKANDENNFSVTDSKSGCKTTVVGKADSSDLIKEDRQIVFPVKTSQEPNDNQTESSDLTRQKRQVDRTETGMGSNEVLSKGIKKQIMSSKDDKPKNTENILAIENQRELSNNTDPNKNLMRQNTLKPDFRKTKTKFQSQSDLKLTDSTKQKNNERKIRRVNTENTLHDTNKPETKSRIPTADYRHRVKRENGSHAVLTKQVSAPHKVRTERVDIHSLQTGEKSVIGKNNSSIEKEENTDKMILSMDKKEELESHTEVQDVLKGADIESTVEDYNRQEIKDVPLNRNDMENDKLSTKSAAKITQLSAVLKIQSLWRGHLVRKNKPTKALNVVSTENAAGEIMNLSKKDKKFNTASDSSDPTALNAVNQTNTDFIKAAVKIQKIFRGFMARKNIKREHKIAILPDRERKNINIVETSRGYKNQANEVVHAEDNLKSASDTILKDQQKFIKAAVTIQKVWRGFKVRNRIKINKIKVSAQMDKSNTIPEETFSAQNLEDIDNDQRKNKQNQRNHKEDPPASAADGEFNSGVLKPSVKITESSLNVRTTLKNEDIKQNESEEELVKDFIKDSPHVSTNNRQDNILGKDRSDKLENETSKVGGKVASVTSECFDMEPQVTAKGAARTRNEEDVSMKKNKNKDDDKETEKDVIRTTESIESPNTKIKHVSSKNELSKDLYSHLENDNVGTSSSKDKEPDKEENSSVIVTKDTTKSLLPSDSSDESTHSENKLRLVTAALIIQKVWRGFKIRNNLKQKRKICNIDKKDNIKNILHKNELKHVGVVAPNRVKTAQDSEKFKKAATKIQAIWRGFAVRKNLNKDYPFGTKVEPEHHITESIEAAEKTGPRSRKSALKIQSLWRGYQVRKNIGVIKNKLEDKIAANDAGKVKELTDGDILNAAKKIQAGVRVYLERKRRKKGVTKLNSIIEEDNLSNSKGTSPKEGQSSMDNALETHKESEKKLSDEEVLKALNKLNDVKIPTDIPFKVNNEKPAFHRSNTVHEPEIIKTNYSPLLTSLSLDSNNNNNNHDLINNDMINNSKALTENNGNMQVDNGSNIISSTQNFAYQKTSDEQKNSLDSKPDLNQLDDQSENSLNHPCDRSVSVDSTDSAVTVIVKHLDKGNKDQNIDDSETEHSIVDIPNGDNAKETLLDHENKINDFQNQLLDHISGKNGDKSSTEEASKFDIDKLRQELKNAGLIYNVNENNIKHQNSNEESTAHDQLLDYLNSFNSDSEDDDVFLAELKYGIPRDLPDIKEEDFKTKSKENNSSNENQDLQNKNISEQISGIKNHELENKINIEKIKSTLRECEDMAQEINMGFKRFESKPDSANEESEHIFCQTPKNCSPNNKTIENQPLFEHVELLNTKKEEKGHKLDQNVKETVAADLLLSEGAESNSGSKNKLLHSSEFHDTVLGFTPQPGTETVSQELSTVKINRSPSPSENTEVTSDHASSSKLLHSGEFHDAVVLTLPFKVNGDSNPEDTHANIASRADHNKTSKLSLTSNLEEGSSGMIHTGEMHDAVVVSIPLSSTLQEHEKSSETTAQVKEVERKEIQTGLLHTGELHDAVVVLLPATGKAKVDTDDDTKADDVPKQVDSASQTISGISGGDSSIAVQLNQAPAGVETLTSRRPVSGVRGVISVDAGIAQASAKDALPNEPSSDLSAPSGLQSMEREKRNNATINNKSMEAEAATKIQAGFRGYQVRKQLKLKNGSSEINNQWRQVRRKSSGRGTDTGRMTHNKQNPSHDVEEKSAVKIQAGVRGFLVRRRQKKQKNQDA